ncbi:MAG: oxygen-independent coproporphyrinogen-3 oxidase [Saprospiraceae bacterium]|jgi:oxygen-independent coproporphyrinogen-3 oxidase
MTNAILRELELQKDYLKGEKVETIYLGGGTPSLLDREELSAIFNQIFELYEVGENPEITLEANPDDLSLEKLQVLKDTPINRLSLGIQSFSEADLKFMNRAHNAKESKICIDLALKMGFDNLTVDLIYGSPTTSDAQWQENMHRVFDYGVQHLSCYNLTVEPGTALDHFVKNKKAKPVDEEQSARQFEMLIDASDRAGYLHYEISNFAKEGWYSRHNSAYWQGKPYLGIGPSAHSFDGSSRQWNVAHNAKYIKSLTDNTLPFEKEILTLEQQYNEYILTGLRTIWGCDIQKIEEIGMLYKNHFLKLVAEYKKAGQVVEMDGVYTLTKRGKLLADRIAMELFF